MRRAARDATFGAMSKLFDFVLALHVLAGGVALAVFWLPLVTKKGGQAHRRFGWVYVVAAATIAVTGFGNCARMLTDGDPRNDGRAMFLAYVATLAAASAQSGVRALGTKHHVAARRSLVDLAPPALLLVFGLALAGFGAVSGVVLYVAFAALGMSIGATQLRFWLLAPRTRIDWLIAHMGGMGVSCITTLTAFLVLNAPRFGVRAFHVAVWMAPAIVGGVGLSLWQRSYRRHATPPGAPETTS
jgi:hypothetical protein